MGKKYLFYCVNGTGIGHLTRSLAVARQLRRLEAGAEVLFLTSSEHSGLLWQERFTCVKVPSTEINRLQPNLPVAALAHALTAQVCATFSPDVLVVDSQACGMHGELLTPLENVRHSAFLFGYFPNYFSVPAYKTALSKYSMVIMPYSETERESLNIDLPEKSQWVGDITIRSVDELFDKQVARARCGLDSDRLSCCIVTGGGGNPRNTSVLKWLLGGIAKRSTWDVACAMQPLADSADLLDGYPDVRRIHHYPMMELMPAFDLCVSACGFNCPEVVHARTPALWVPLGKPSTDQEFNAARMSRNGFGKVVRPLNSDALAQTLDYYEDSANRAAERQRSSDWQDENGAVLAARLIAALADK